MRNPNVWVSRASSALVGAFTQLKRSEPSGYSTYTPSRNSMWSSTSKRSAFALLRLFRRQRRYCR